ncbi:hypothetical protein ARZXY2_2538 [Arthrobacter sp. ZXY-2]|nr:hypothetical protein ARZXY2_2538 [Arthrobacter sp. ZXY-2]
MSRDDCLHMGEHCAPLHCPDCGRFSRHSWTTEYHYTENDGNQYWGGECVRHGEWSDAAA